MVRSRRLADRGPSLTARGIAHARASFARPSTPTGEPRLAELLAQDLGKPLPVQRSRGFVAYVRARTRFFDEQVAEAAASGPRQVVIVGAGYDDRSFRFRTPGVRFVEVDHPATQADKCKRLDRLGVPLGDDIAFVPVDLEADGLEQALGAHLDDRVPTTIVCESVLPYLTSGAAEGVLQVLSRSAGTDGRLNADLPVVPKRLRGRITMRTWRMLAGAIGEPVRTTLRFAEVTPFLRAGGWHEERRTTGRELGMPAGRAEWCFVVARSRTPT